MPLLSAGALLLSVAVVAYANRAVGRRGDCRALWLALPLLCLRCQRRLQHRAVAQDERARCHRLRGAGGGRLFCLCAAILALFALARRAAGKMDAVRRVTFDNARLFWQYTVLQSLAGLALVHGFPRLVA